MVGIFFASAAAPTRARWLKNIEPIDLKKAVIAAAIDAKVGLLVSVILHDIAKSPDIARLNAINTLCFHFDCLIGRIPGPGSVLIDRFTDKQMTPIWLKNFALA